MERNLALEVVRATEAAALGASRFIGKGDERMADRAACDAMRKTLNSVAMDGKIVIGEGKEGDAEFLYEGEIVGTGAGTEIDVAVDADHRGNKIPRPQREPPPHDPVGA